VKRLGRGQNGEGRNVHKWTGQTKRRQLAVVVLSITLC